MHATLCKHTGLLHFFFISIYVTVSRKPNPTVYGCIAAAVVVVVVAPEASVPTINNDLTGLLLHIIYIHSFEYKINVQND